MELARSHLVAEPAAGRFTFHDLLRAYAQELAWTRDSEAERRAAVSRVLDHYLHTAYRAWQARALNAVGWCHAVLADHRQAIEHCEQALDLLRELGDRYGEAATWDSLGFAHHRLGEQDRAVACYRQALALRRDIGDRLHEAETLTHLGDVQHAIGDHTAARRAWSQALVIFDQLDHPAADQVRGKL